MHQEQSPTMIRIQLLRQAGDTRGAWKPIALILDLPDQPVGSENPADAQTFVRVTCIAMTHGIHNGLLQSQLQPARGFLAINRIEKQLQQRA